MENSAPPPYTQNAPRSPVSPPNAGPSTSVLPPPPASPPQYSAQKRLVLWCAEGGGKQGRRARDLTLDLAPPTAMKKFSLDNQNITHVRHGDDGCSCTPRTMTTRGYVLTGKIEMWSETHRTHEYHWGGQPCDRAIRWHLVGASDGAHIRRDVNTVVDITPHQVSHPVPATLIPAGTLVPCTCGCTRGAHRQARPRSARCPHSQRWGCSLGRWLRGVCGRRRLVPVTTPGIWYR
jgi:hypothetical protein